MINALLIGFSNLFVYCYFGKLSTESFEKMSNCVNESNWHELSIDLQKYFVLIIQNIQRPVFYHGSKLIVLNLETFTGVSRIKYFFFSVLEI